MKKQQLIVSTVLGLGLYLIATGVSYAVFSIAKPSTTPVKEVPKLTSISKGPKKHFTIADSVPRTQVCPINGIKYTKQEEEIWTKRRPLAVMIENHADSRPQSGLSFADVVYESVAEGGITRFMAVFYCGIANVNVPLAPVRSARTFFLPWVLEYDALYNHVGGAGNCNDDTVDQRAKALCQIQQYGIKDLDQFGIPFPTCYRNYDRLDHTVATEHTMVCETDKLYSFAEKQKDWTNVDEDGIAWDKNFEPWKFKDDAPASSRGTVASLSFTAWKGYEKDYGVTWRYDSTNNVYLRENGGVAHKDLETDQQLKAKAVVVLFAKETGPVDDHMHLLYQNIGSGNGVLFQDGKAEKVTWKKQTRTDRTVFYDTAGKEVEFNRGQLWIEMLPTGTTVTY